MATDAEIIARKLALFVIVGYLPNDYPTPDTPDPRWEAMIGTRYADGKLYWTKTDGVPNGGQVAAWAKGTTGTTCGYLPHWMLWAIGCRDWATMNREDDAWNTSLYDAARGGEAIHWIIKIGTAKLLFDYRPRFPTGSEERKEKTSPIWVTPTPGALPEIGDVLYIQDPAGTGGDHHVFVFLGLTSDGKQWLTAEAGQQSERLKVLGLYKSCASRFKLRTPLFYPKRSSTRQIGFEEEAKRTVHGWLSLGGLLATRPERWVDAELPRLSDGVFAGATVGQLPKASEREQRGGGILAELAWRLVYEFLGTVYESDPVYSQLYEQIPDVVWNLAYDLWRSMGSPSFWSMGFPSLGGTLSQEQESLRVAATAEASSRLLAKLEGRRPDPSPTLSGAAFRAHVGALEAEVARRAASWLDLGAVEGGSATLDLHLDEVDES